MIALDSGTSPEFGIMPSHVYNLVGLGEEGYMIKNPYAAPITTMKYLSKLRKEKDQNARQSYPM